MSFITNVFKTNVKNNLNSLKKDSKVFFESFITDDVLENYEDILDCKVHEIKSLDGYALKAFEKTKDTSLDYVILIHDVNDSLSSLELISQNFLDNNINVIKVQTRNGLFNYAKEYLDILSWLNYFRSIYPSNRIYLYGIGVGANMCVSALKSDTSNMIDAIVLDNIKLDFIYSCFKDFAIKHRVLNVKNLFNKVNKLCNLNNYGDLNLYYVDNVLQTNKIPVIFLEKSNKSTKRFLKFYNSNKSTKKILYLESGLNKKDIALKYNKLCDALKSLNNNEH